MTYIDTWKSYLKDLRDSVTKPASMLAAFYALIAFLGNQGLVYYKAQTEAKEKRVAERVISVLESTKEFDTLAALLANAVMDSAGESDARVKLIANLNKQYAELDLVQPLVRDNAIPAQYKKNLVELAEVIPEATSPEKMRSYWESLSKVLKARKPLTIALAKQVSLETN